MGRDRRLPARVHHEHAEEPVQSLVALVTVVPVCARRISLESVGERLRGKYGALGQVWNAVHEIIISLEQTMPVYGYDLTDQLIDDLDFNLFELYIYFFKYLNSIDQIT